MRMKDFILTALVLYIYSVPALQAAEPLVFSTAPTHSTKKTLEMYQPIVDYLSEANRQRNCNRHGNNIYRIQQQSAKE